MKNQIQKFRKSVEEPAPKKILVIDGKIYHVSPEDLNTLTDASKNRPTKVFESIAKELSKKYQSVGYVDSIFVKDVNTPTVTATVFISF